MADGVAIMVESYLRLGLNELADTSLALLKENYPDHISIDDDGDGVPDALESSNNDEESGSNGIVIIAFVFLFLAAAIILLRRKQVVE